MTDARIPEERTSARAVLGFVLGYWRRVPVRFALMLVGTTLGVLLEVQIPRLSAELVSSTEALLRGAVGSEVAWRSAWALIGVFAAVSVVTELYLRNWICLASQVMGDIPSETREDQLAGTIAS